MASQPGKDGARAVLFDLDGTLADTVPDLAAAINLLRRDQGLDELPLERVRPFASAGARGLVHVGFGVDPGNPEFVPLRDAFLEHYRERTCIGTRLFPGIPELLAELGARAIAWGIVTNKAMRFTDRIVAALRLDPACVVCGDTTPHIKPHPAQLLHAAGLLGLSAAACWYLGDDLRDMQAAKAAGMRAVAVQWGYHHPDSGSPGSWQAHTVIDHPLDLIRHL